MNQPLDTADISTLHALFAEQAAAGEAALAEERVTVREVRKNFALDMQFLGQSHVVRVPLDGPEPDRDTIRRRFDEVYFARFRIELDRTPVRIVNVATSVVGRSDPPDLSRLIDPAGRRVVAEPEGSRRVVFETGAVETPVYRRDRLPLDAEIQGPAIFEQMDTTIFVEPGWRATGDPHGNLVLEART